jgi:hypothetical protein
MSGEFLAIRSGDRIRAWTLNRDHVTRDDVPLLIEPKLDDKAQVKLKRSRRTAWKGTYPHPADRLAPLNYSDTQQRVGGKQRFFGYALEKANLRTSRCRAQEGENS